MTHSLRKASLVIGTLVGVLWTPLSMGYAADMSSDVAARYILETIQAFRAAYVLNVVEHVKESGVVSREDWEGHGQGIPLPAQFVKAAGAQINDFEVGLIGLTPLNKANLPKTQAESDSLMRMASNRDQRMVTFMDGNQFKALASDFAIVQSCVDCHNAHPNASWKKFRRWDLMGAIIIRMRPEGK
jgi:hypothetical protein